MKISTKGRYGLRILLDLAVHENDTPRMIRDIAESQQISEKYISRLIIDLRRAGMVRSIRGAKGGFRLSRTPAEITLLDVVEAMEGPLAIVDCVSEPGKCAHHCRCITREIWEDLNGEIRVAMGKMTLQGIMDRYRARSASGAPLDYCI